MLAEVVLLTCCMMDVHHVTCGCADMRECSTFVKHIHQAHTSSMFVEHIHQAHVPSKLLT